MLPAVLLAAAGCNSDAPTAVSRRTVATDAPLSARVESRPAFGFLPPLGAAPATQGGLDTMQHPTVEIRCESANCPGGSDAIVAFFTNAQANGSLRVTGDHYAADWKTLRSLPADATYRVRVLLATTELGHVDLVARAASSNRSDDGPTFRPGETVPIAFWITQGTIAVISASSGGTARLAGNAVTLAFSPGAVSDDIAVTASAVGSSSPGYDASVIASTLFEFQPSPTTFAAPVKLSLAYPSTLPRTVRASRLAICHVLGSACEALQGSVVDPVGHTVSAQIRSFSSYGVTQFPDMLYMESHGEGWWLHTSAGEIAFPNGEGGGTWTPDGSAFLYMISSDYHTYALRLVSADGSGDHQIIGDAYDPGGGGVRCPGYFPDGSKILADADARPVIINADGSGLFFPLTGLDHPVAGERFDTDWCAERLSPDGQKIAFRAFAPAGSSDSSAIWVMNVDGSDIHQLIQTSHYGPFDWSADGSSIAFVADWAGSFSGHGIYVANADGSNLRQLLGVCGEGDPYGDGGNAQDYGWSPIPGDNRLLIGAYGNVSQCALSLSPGISAVDVSTGRTQLIVPVDPSVSSPSTAQWSADASRISIEWRGGPLPAGDGYPTTYVANTDGSGLQLLLGPGRVGVNAVWRP